MANALRELFTNIASAIKEKTGDNATMKPAEFPDKIRSIDVPEILEDMSIALDFSGGDQEVVAPDGFVVKSAVIQQPANLTPENIAEGVDIGGIIGTLVGGSKVKITTGIVTTAQTSAAVTVNHGLGVVPDMVIAWGASATSRTYFAIAVSKAFTALYGFDRYVAALYTANQKTNSYFVGNLDDDSISNGCVGKANETTFVYQGTITYKIPANAKWLAIAGLT